MKQRSVQSLSASQRTVFTTGGTLSRASCWFTVSLASLVLLSAVNVGAGTTPVSFTADSPTVNQGNFSLPITVNNFTDLSGTQFALTWDTSVLTLQATAYANVNSAISSGTVAFNKPTAGVLTFLWYTFDSATIESGGKLFDVQFTTVTSSGSTAVSFTDYGATTREVSFYDTSSGTPDNGLMILNNGMVTVVPEPINCALGLFASVSIGAVVVRKLRHLRR